MIAYAPDVNCALCGTVHVISVPHVPAVHATVFAHDDMSVAGAGVVEGVGENDRENEGVAEGVAEPERDAVCEAVPAAAEPDGEGVPLGVGDAVGVGEPAGVRDGDGDAVGVGEPEAEREPVADADAPPAVWDADAPPAVGDFDGEGDLEGVLLGDAGMPAIVTSCRSFWRPT